MKKLWEQLKPQERRWLIAILCVVFITLNYFFIWPEFKQWSVNTQRMKTATEKTATYRAEIAHQAEYKRKIAQLDTESQNIPLEDQAVHFENYFRDRAIENGVQIQSTSRLQTRTDAFTMEQQTTIQVLAAEKNLVDFLYSLGSSGSLMRVKAMSLRPLDMNRYQLHADLTLAESYLRNPAPATPGKPGMAANTVNPGNNRGP
jgi:type II secretory pathway component PulM